MSNKTLVVVQDGARVQIKTRQWDGIDNPEYVHLLYCTPLEASSYAHSLLSVAEDAQKHQDELDTNQIKSLEKEIKRKLDDLEALKREKASMKRKALRK